MGKNILTSECSKLTSQVIEFTQSLSPLGACTCSDKRNVVSLMIQCAVLSGLSFLTNKSEPFKLEFRMNPIMVLVLPNFY